MSKESYSGIERSPTISVGIIEIDDNCYFTENEIEGKAGEAKKIAKGQDGKNGLAVYKKNGSIELINKI